MRLRPRAWAVVAPLRARWSRSAPPPHSTPAGRGRAGGRGVGRGWVGVCKAQRWGRGGGRGGGWVGTGWGWGAKLGGWGEGMGGGCTSRGVWQGGVGGARGGGGGGAAARSCMAAPGLGCPPPSSPPQTAHAQLQCGREQQLQEHAARHATPPRTRLCALPGGAPPTASVLLTHRLPPEPLATQELPGIPGLPYPRIPTNQHT